ncbi:MAG TPA: hypothetical protein VIH57_08430 [Bacteroidales bacterium]
MKKKRNKKQSSNRNNKSHIKNIPPLMQKLTLQPTIAIQPVNSLLDKMVDGREFESLLPYKAVNIDFASEIRRSLKEIESIRKKPVICYLSNIVNSNIKASTSIDYNDDLPFSEMLSSIPSSIKEIDIILVTPGGSAEQVAKFVDKLRPRFDSVSFILPNMAMSAGTIFVMSGNEIIMDSRAYIGPIDPQIPNKDGFYVPAQAILTLIEDIQNRGDDLLKKGQNPLWTDLQILHQMDSKDIGNALNASKYSIELVESYLYNYKFKTWTHHSNGNIVTDTEKQTRAHDIAMLLCNHGLWKTHRRGITREVAWQNCRLKIIHPETITGLDRTIRRFWALLYWVFENTPVYKIFISENYSIFRHDISLITGR